ncbi:MAG TPA: helix-turn-helix transcriptional regulator [Rhizomicrobium sp.]|nr:helix-turn-helix transcriptional regulator [Rhizomicrobium sp.]
MLFLALDIVTIGCNVLFGARVLARHPRNISAQIAALIAFNTICHIVLSRQEYGYWIAAPYQFHVGDWAPVLNFARNLTPGLFMVLCFTLFADRQRFPRWLIALFAFEAFLEGPGRWFLPLNGVPGDLELRILPAILQTIFAGFSLYWSLANWSGDLVETRLRARIVLASVIALNIIGSSLLRVLAQDSIANYYGHVALTAVNLAILIFLLVFLSDDSLAVPLETKRAPVHPLASTPESDPALAKLRELLEREYIYRRPSLTLRDLADAMQLPEYRLRKLIHERLGYQNFNAFLHDYRIRDACRQLRDPAMKRVPILTIALSTGYQSVNTFNRGFREVMGMTPSAYRSLDRTPELPGKISPQST